MAKIVVATLNVNFSEDSESSTAGVLKLEIDDRENGLNGGDTSFQPGDTVGFWLFKDSNGTLETPVPISTSVGVTGAGTGSLAVDEFIAFSNSDTASLGYPPNREALAADSGHGGISQSSGCARKEYDRDRQDEGKRAKKIGEQGVDRRRR